MVLLTCTSCKRTPSIITYSSSPSGPTNGTQPHPISSSIAVPMLPNGAESITQMQTISQVSELVPLPEATPHQGDAPPDYAEAIRMRTVSHAIDLSSNSYSICDITHTSCMVRTNFKYAVYSTMVASYTIAHAKIESSSAMLKRALNYHNQKCTCIRNNIS